MAYPPLVASGDIIAASHVNALRNGQMTWAGDVDADGHDFNDAGDITAVSVAASGTVSGASVTASGAVTGGTGAFSGAVTAASLALSGALTALSVTASGAMSSFTGAGGGTSARFSDASNSTLMVTHGASPVPNSAVIEGTGSTSITLKSPAGIVARIVNTARESIGQVTIPDGSTVSLAQLCAGGTYGSLQLIAVAANIFGEVQLQGGLNSVTQISDIGGSIATTDTAGQLCVLPAGGGAYSIKNRIGASVTLVVRFIGL